MKKSEGWGILGAIGLVFIAAGFMIDTIHATIPLSVICTCICLYYQIKNEKEETEEDDTRPYDGSPYRGF